MNIALILQICSCFFMTGVIWLVQILVYPSFSLHSETFNKCHDFHTRRITFIVAPVMVVELFSGLWLCLSDTSPFYAWNIAGICLLWLLTGLVSVPIHNRIQKDPERLTHWLTQTNWPRTLVWTFRSLGWLWILNIKLSGVNL